jgi:hypothetical protein
MPPRTATEYIFLEEIMASDLNQHSFKSTAVQTDIASLQQAIQLRALQIYEQRGRETGNELEDWLQAERELTAPQTKKAAA